MNITRRMVLAAMAGFGFTSTSFAQATAMPAQEVLLNWFNVVLKLVRHTPTYSPPVASRSFGYLGVTAFEAVASGSGELLSLAGQLNGFQPGPRREAGQAYDEAVVLQAALAHAVQDLFSNTGPTGQRVMTLVEAKLRAGVLGSLAPDVVARSEAYGRSLATHVLEWSRGDGGAVVENMGFPLEYQLKAGPANWVPTSLVVQQQKPLLPDWGNKRTFAMPNGASCSLPAPPAYSEDKASEFYKESFEVYDTTTKLTPEQRAIARFWSDDPMLSPTPPGHWMAITLQILERDAVKLEAGVDVLARMGITLSDAFVGCWNSKFQYDLLRPVTYIKRVIDPKWEPMLITPPFPEYPSGHSTQSGAAAVVLTEFFGENFAFEDTTHGRDGLQARKFPSFWAAANEAGISRLYGGIHFRSAIERGLEQGRCVGAYATALRTRR